MQQVTRIAGPHWPGFSLILLLGPEDDLAAGAAAFELGVGLADLRQRVDVRDRHLEVPVGDQVGQLGEHLGTRPGRCSPVSLHPVLRGGREIDDRVNPLGGQLVTLTTPGAGDSLVLSEGVPAGMLDFAGDSVAGDSAGVDHIGFVLKDPAELDQAIELLVSLGGTLVCTLRPNKESAFLRDPDGYVIQI
jgi:catechol 2,3-dioxygenase-like lactoylglutathione lyase family enzyme